MYRTRSGCFKRLTSVCNDHPNQASNDFGSHSPFLFLKVDLYIKSEMMTLKVIEVHHETGSEIAKIAITQTSSQHKVHRKHKRKSPLRLRVCYD